MPQGISIHIGLNQVDPAQYGGWDGALAGCINDAHAMRDIAQQMGYSPITVLLDDQATATNVLHAISSAAMTLQSGDILFLTYSGHGGQVPDENGDEEDSSDETWVLYDRMVMDDELYLLWSQFAPGVRIVMLSDSCHSGTVYKLKLYNDLASQPQFAKSYRQQVGSAPAFRAIPPVTANLAYIQNQAQYESLQWLSVRGKNTPIAASVLLISGCQDSQLSGDGYPNGVFTAAVRDLWQNGSFTGGYRAFHSRILERMPELQTPNYAMIGQPNAAFEAQQPFSIGGGSSTEAPKIALSPLWAWGEPVFEITLGSNAYYAVEVATNPLLFDGEGYGAERTDDNFYGSWSNAPLITDPTYTLDPNAWVRLSSMSSRLYYRVLTSSIREGWENMLASTSDADAADAPYLDVRRVLQHA